MIERNRKTYGVVMAAILALAGCSDSPLETSEPVSALEVAQPEGWDADIALPEAVDLNDDPDILEIELNARITDIELVPGQPTPVWTYNGLLPGPLIRAKVGDKIIVRFKNELPEATSIHWHGLRLPNNMDGVPGVTQDPVPAGGEFVYEFTARDAGTFWYHPHINSADQVGRGLYGPVLVTDPADSEVFGDDIVLLLSDMSIDDESGQFLPPDQGGEFGDLFGREGNTLLVNGKIRPRLKARAGKPQRWRIINAARSRYYTVQLQDHRFIKLGGDNGFAERSADVYRVVLVPGERADLVFTPSGAPGSLYTMQWIPTDRGFGSLFNRPRVDMLDIELVADAPVEPEPVPEFLREIEPIDISNAIERDLDLTIDSERGPHGNEVVMGINGIPFWRSQALEAQIGQTQVWNVLNDTAFAHPFHLHGYFFQVLDDTRIPEWKDTVDVPAESSIRLAVRFDERPGVWMYHCHILDHADSGMMGHLWVAADAHDKMPHVKLVH